MLRNSASAAGAASQLTKLLYSYRSYKLRAAARSLLYLLACAVIFMLWTVCALYAPYVYTRTGSDVLLAESPYCGFALPQVSDSVNGGDTFNMFQKRDIDLVSSADAYVQQCYNESTTTAQCSTFPRQSLPYKRTVVDCPFGSIKDLCLTVNSSTIQLDTGLLDSNFDFGINARGSETLKYRHVATCSPLGAGSAGFVDIVNTTGTDLAASYPPGETLVSRPCEECRCMCQWLTPSSISSNICMDQRTRQIIPTFTPNMSACTRRTTKLRTLHATYG